MRLLTDIEEQTEFWKLSISRWRRSCPRPVSRPRNLHHHHTSTPETMPANVNIDDLMAKVYPDLRHNVGNVQYLNQRAVLYPTNDNVEKVNDHIMSAIKGESREVLSQDSIDKVTIE
jgi:hypothetical protein